MYFVCHQYEEFVKHALQETVFSRRTHPLADAMEADNEGKAISLSISGVFDLPIVAGPLLPGAL